MSKNMFVNLRKTGVCDPCSNPFDFVAKFETLTQDANWLLERAASNLTFPEHQEDTGTIYCLL